MTDEVQLSQDVAAAKMLKRSVNLCPSADVGMNVKLKLDKVDRGPADSPAILCVVLEKREDSAVKLGCSKGRLQGWWFSNSYAIVKQSILQAENVPNQEFQSLRTANGSISQFGTQGHVHCNCTKGGVTNERAC